MPQHLTSTVRVVLSAFRNILPTFNAFDNNIRNTVSDSGCRTRISLLHALRQFDMGLLASIIGFGKGLSDDQLRHIHFVLQEICDSLLDIAVGKCDQLS